MPRIRPHRHWPAGRVERFRHRSSVLEGNPWEDPVERELPVYLPPGYDESASEAYPVFWCLAPFTNAGPGQVNWKNFRESLPERLDRLIGQGDLGPVVVVFPDCFTSLGGNQYLNSGAVGRYADYLFEELVPFVESALRVRAGPAGRAAFGKSSGGYGALYHAMTRPGAWGAVASHAGDAGFDLCYRGDFPSAATTLAAFDGDVAAFLEDFWTGGQVTGSRIGALMALAMAASYDPDPASATGIRLPFDPETCELDESRWARWLAHDPVHLAGEPACLDNLRSLKGLWIDCGRRDEFHIQYGTRRLARRLREGDVPHVHEEFDGTHSGIDFRFDRSLPYLYRALTR